MNMNKLAHRLALIFCLSAALPAQSHEFWIAPAANPLQVGDTARLTLQVGEFFRGDTLAFAGPQTAALRHYTAAGVRDLAPLLSVRATLASSWVGVLGIRMLDRVGKGLRSSPRDALLAASVPPERRGLAFGLHRSMDNAGAVLGPILAAVLLGYGFKVRDLFVISIIPAVLCLGMSLLIREPKNALAEVRRGKFSWNFHNLPIEFKRYLLAVVVFTLGNSSNMFLLLRARELGLPEAQVPLAWATISAIAMIFGTPLSALSDRFGRIGSIAAGWLAYGLFYLSLGFLPPGNSALLFSLFAFYGLFLAATEGVEKALVADLAPSAMLGTAYGWFNLASGMMLLPASIIFGWLYETAGATIAFEFSASCAVVSTVLLFRVKLRAD